MADCCDPPLPPPLGTPGHRARKQSPVRSHRQRMDFIFRRIVQHFHSSLRVDPVDQPALIRTRVHPAGRVPNQRNHIMVFALVDLVDLSGRRDTQDASVSPAGGRVKASLSIRRQRPDVLISGPTERLRLSARNNPVHNTVRGRAGKERPVRSHGETENGYFGRVEQERRRFGAVVGEDLSAIARGDIQPTASAFGERPDEVFARIRCDLHLGSK